MSYTVTFNYIYGDVIYISIHNNQEEIFSDNGGLLTPFFITQLINRHGFKEDYDYIEEIDKWDMTLSWSLTYIVTMDMYEKILDYIHNYYSSINLSSI